MAEDKLHKEVVKPPAASPALAVMKRKIDGLQKLYVVLFVASLVILVYGWKSVMPLYGHIAWAATLGGAVLTRITRSSLVAKYNSALLGGGPAPLV